MTNVPAKVKVLFVCSHNEIRSLTAERMLAGMPGFQARSAGTEPGARVRVTAGHLGWADIIFVMEKRHRDRLAQKFGDVLAEKTVVCLHIPDEYHFMDDALIEVLQARLEGHLDLTHEPPVLDQPVRRLLSLLSQARDGSRTLIALAGLPGAGKSTLAAQMTEQVNASAGPGTMAALGMDGFHRTKADLRRFPDPAAAFARRGAPWTFDLHALAMRLKVLRDGVGRETVGWPDFQHAVGDPQQDVLTIAPDVRLVLVEGLYLLKRDDGWDTVSGVFDERWYLDTPLEIVSERLVRRHMTSWGLSRQEAELRVAANDRLNAQIVIKSRAYADWLLAP